MPLRHLTLTISGAFALFFFTCSPVQAMRVKNLDDITHQLVVASTPGDERVIELQPGEIFTTYSPAVSMRLITGPFPGTQTARYLDEFIIWPDGRLHIQKRRWPGHRAFGL